MYHRLGYGSLEQELLMTCYIPPSNPSRSAIHNTDGRVKFAHFRQVVDCRTGDLSDNLRLGDAVVKTGKTPVNNGKE